jgi:hypothetical protein
VISASAGRNVGVATLRSAAVNEERIVQDLIRRADAWLKARFCDPMWMMRRLAVVVGKAVRA